MSKFTPDLAVGNEDLAKLLKSIVTDLLALETAVEAITAKLDADGGVTDTDYASTANPTLEVSLQYNTSNTLPIGMP